MMADSGGDDEDLPGTVSRVGRKVAADASVGATVGVVLLISFGIVLVVFTFSTHHAGNKDTMQQDNPAPATKERPKPNVVFVLADDLGYDDVSYHGGSQIKTPTIDELSSQGVKLENYYVQPACSPTRSQLMTGRYQIRMGLSHGIIRPMQAKAVPLDEVLLPQRMKDLGYNTHMVGKWHLGHHTANLMPHYRGFDTFYGTLLGAGDYFRHQRGFPKTKKSFLDLRDNNGPIRNETGHYSTHLFTEKAIDVINSQTVDKPFFLYLSYQAVHGPLEIPDDYKHLYPDIKDRYRRTLASMVSILDEGVANVTRALKAKGLWDNTVFVFSTDNGAHIPGKYNNGRNWPLRGGKATLFEGGIKAVGFVTGGRHVLNQRGVTSRELIHVSDWLPTIVRGVAGGSIEGGKPLDGFDQWKTISAGTASPRTILLHNIDTKSWRLGKPRYSDTFDTSIRAGLRVGEMKLLTGRIGGFRHWEPPPDGGNYSVPVNNDPKNKNVWLFNLTSDPYETSDLSSQRPGKVKAMLRLLSKFKADAVEPFEPPDDPRSNPGLLGGAWGPWL